MSLEIMWAKKVNLYPNVNNCVVTISRHINSDEIPLYGTIIGTTATTIVFQTDESPNYKPIHGKYSDDGVHKSVTLQSVDTRLMPISWNL